MNKPIISVSFAYLFICLILSGCANEFDPLIEMELDRLMVFSILDNRLQSQCCYLQRNYQKSGDGKDVGDCRIFLIEDEKRIYEFRDTTAEDETFCRYYIPNIKLKRNIKYQIMVVKDSLTKCWSSTYLHSIPVDSINWVLNNDASGIHNGYEATIYFSNEFLDSEEECYYEFRTFMEYEVNRDGIIKTKYREIPYDIEISDDFKEILAKSNYGLFEIPEAWYSIYSAKGFSKEKIKKYKYIPLAVNAAFALMKEGYDPKEITVKRAFTVVKTITPFYYENGVMQKWESMMSTRFDIPPVKTNINTLKNEGLGIFGAITIDTVNFKIDSAAIDRFQYKDGQKNKL